METLVANLIGKTRRDTFDGREFIVAPLTLIVPGVLNGSKGPLFYPLEEIAKNADAWNGIPLVVDHPEKNGSPVSARSPAVLNGQGIGHLFGATANGKLTAEGWFDVEKTGRVDNRILDSLRNGKPIELSTGLFTRDEPLGKPGIFEGKPYSFVAHDLRPDHLAILPDSIGACSNTDGCGVLVNSEAQLVGRTGEKNGHTHTATVGGTSGFGFASFDSGHAHQIKNFRVLRGRTGHNHPLPRVALIDSGVRNVAMEERSPNTTDRGGQEMSLSDAQRKEIVDGLIANTCCWEDEDREVLNEFGDKKLIAMRDHGEIETLREKELLVANAAKEKFKGADGSEYTWDDKKGWSMEPKKKEPEPVTNQIAPPTEEEWMKSAPAAVREDLEFARNEKHRQKTALVEKLVASVKDEQEQARLTTNFMKKGLSDLQDMAAIVPEPKTRTQTSYAGAATPESGVQNVEQDFAEFGLPHEYIAEPKED